MELVPSVASSGLTTRARLLRAAEKLFAEHGIGATSTRSILREAQQRNESALQYHFGGREQLIEALYAERGSQVNEERAVMLRETLRQEAVGLRQLCELALMPPVRIARRQPEFILFLKVIGELVFLPSAKMKESRQRLEIDTVAKVVGLIRSELDLPKALIERRLELIDRMATLLLAQRARADESFEGPDADLFFATLLDAMVEVLRGPVSRETERCLASTPARSKKKASRTKKKSR